MTPPEPEVSLRPATAGDRNFFASVYFSTRQEELMPLPWTQEEKALFLAQQFEAQSVHYTGHFGDASTDVILVDGEPAGRLIVMRYEEETLIVDIALLPQHRSRGVGTTLLRRLIEEAEARGSALAIHVERTNRAIGLYRRLGFDEAGGDGVYARMQRCPSA